MGIQTIRGIVKDANEAVWADSPIELGFSDGYIPLSNLNISAKTNVAGGFKFTVYNNANAVQPAILRLPDDSLFGFDLDPQDATVDVGTLIASGVAGNPRLYEVEQTRLYRVSINQSSDEAPDVAGEFVNTVGIPVWTRTSEGLYTGELAGAFPGDKTYIESPVFRDSSGDLAKVYWHSNDAIRIATTTDGRLNNATISVLVYI